MLNFLIKVEIRLIKIIAIPGMILTFLFGIILLEHPRFNLECWILFLTTIHNLYFENLLLSNNLLFDTKRISQFNFAQKIGVSI